MTIAEVKRQLFMDSDDVLGNDMVDLDEAQNCCDTSFSIGYNKAIADFMELASNHNYGDSDAKEYVMDIVKNLAEQLRNQWGEYGK